MISRIAALSLWAAAATLMPVAVTGQTASVTLTAEDMRVLAQDLLNAGDPAGARDVAGALLDRNPNDVPALIFGAQAALEQNQPRAAVPLATRAFRKADDDTARYVAARLAARAHAELLQDTRAQVWLRLAREYAPDARNALSVAEDYAFLRERNPLSVSLSFGISPSSNINNGSKSETAELFGQSFYLSQSAQALSGVGFSIGANLQYRVKSYEGEATFVDVDVSKTTYALSNESLDRLNQDYLAAQQAGRDTSDIERSGSDFSDAQLSFGLTHRRILNGAASPTTFAARLGQNWYGGDVYQQFLNAGVSHSFAIAERSRVNVNASAQQQWGTSNYQDAQSLSFGVGYRHLLENGNLIGLSFGNRNSRSRDAERDYNAVQVGASLDLAEPIYDVRFGFGVNLEQRDYDYSFYTTGPRTDRTVSLRVSALFEAVEYFGFQPVATFSAGRTYSDAGRFDLEYANVGLDVRSSF